MSKHKEILEILGRCAAACNHCADACLGEENVKMMVKCIRTDRDCARICELTAAFVASGSEFTGSIMKVCADICKACGDECASHEHDHCRKCAEACRECEKACRSFSAAA